MEYAVVLDHVTKQYKKNIVAVADVNYSFSSGTFYAIQGASGSGKTTLLQMIGTLDSPTKGTVWVQGQDTTLCSEGRRTRLRCGEIGFVFQNYMLNAKLKAYENVMLPMLAASRKSKECRQRARTLLADLGLGNRLDHYPHQLSGGEQQRVAVARAMANRPAVLIADEPTGSLDEENELTLLKMFRKLTEAGVCVITVTHNQSVSNYADVLLRMSDGKLAPHSDVVLKHADGRDSE